MGELVPYRCFWCDTIQRLGSRHKLSLALGRGDDGDAPSDDGDAPSIISLLGGFVVEPCYVSVDGVGLWTKALP